MLYTLTDNINLYRSIFENNALGITIHDIDLNIVEVNSAFCRLLGYTEGELLNLNLVHITPEQDVSRIHRNLANFRIGKYNSIKLNRPYIKKDGSMLYANTDINAVRDNIGNLEFFILSIQDNHKYKITHQTLLQTEKRYQILFENNLNGISVWDNMGYLIEANPAFCHLLDYKEEELLVKRVDEIIAPVDRESTYVYFNQLQTGQLPSFISKRRLLTKQGKELLCNIAVRGVYDKQNNYTGAVASVQNISEFEKQDRIIWKLNRVMQKSGRAYARLEGFVHIASENLRAQIQDLNHFAQQIAPDTPHQQLTKTINTKTQTINSTLESLLNYTNIQAQNNKLQATNMQELIDGVLSNFKKSKRDANITTQDLPHSIEIDKNKIIQLLHQLIHNSLKFCTPDTSPCIHIKAEEKNDHWIFTLSDNGIGIPKEYAYHIFVPFKQLDSNTEGAGMGLAICKTIIEQHQGKIYVASDLQEKQGTTLTFSISKSIQ